MNGKSLESHQFLRLQLCKTMLSCPESGFVFSRVDEGRFIHIENTLYSFTY